MAVRAPPNAPQSSWRSSWRYLRSLDARAVFTAARVVLPTVVRW
jgi:hypothetical protein